MEIKLAKKENGFVGNSTNFRDTIFLGCWVKEAHGCIGIISHDSLHLALADLDEDVHKGFDDIRKLLKGCLGI